jgi:hypothetical protein
MYPRVDETKQILPFLRVLAISLVAAYLASSGSPFSEHERTYPSSPSLYPVSHVHSLDEVLLGHFDEELGFRASSTEEHGIRGFSIVTSNHRLEGFLGSLRGSQGVRVVCEFLVIRLANGLDGFGERGC